MMTEEYAFSGYPYYIRKRSRQAFCDGVTPENYTQAAGHCANGRWTMDDGRWTMDQDSCSRCLPVRGQKKNPA